MPAAVPDRFKTAVRARSPRRFASCGLASRDRTAASRSFALPICPICKKAVCETCAFRMGGSIFCGSPCANAFFFGGQEDVEDESDLGLLEEE